MRNPSDYHSFFAHFALSLQFAELALIISHFPLFLFLFITFSLGWRTTQREEEAARERNLNAFMTGLKDKNKRVVTRARSLARSLFDTICNCTNNVSNPIQQAATRLRRQQTAFERVETSERSERSSSVPRQQTRFDSEIWMHK